MTKGLDAGGSDLMMVSQHCGTIRKLVKQDVAQLEAHVGMPLKDLPCIQTPLCQASQSLVW